MSNENTAEVLDQDGPKQDTAEELAAAAAAQAGAVDLQANENDLDDETEHKRLGGWQRKIKRLEAERETLIETLRKVGGNAQTSQTQTATQQEDKPPAKPVRPKMADFTGADAWEHYEAAREKYDDDRDKYHEDNLSYQLRRQDVVKQQKSEQEKIVNSFAQQCDELEKEVPDFKEVAFSENVAMSDAMRDAILTSEFGARIALELGKNPAEAERIAKLNPVVAIREIGKIESRISSAKQATEENKDDLQVATSRAPRPPSPVRRTSSVNIDPDDKDDYKTWLKKREAQLARK